MEVGGSPLLKEISEVEPADCWMAVNRLFFYPYRLVDVTFQGYDLNSPPLKPFVMSRRFRLFFIAYSTGLLVIEKGQVLMAAKEDVGSLLDRRLLDLSIGKVDILALSTDERLLAVCIPDIIYIFDVESFMVQNMEPRCSIPLPQAGFIKDIVWRKAAKYNFLVLTKDGKLFHGKFPDPSLTELMDGIDAVESSDIGDIVVAKQNNITVFSSDLNEKMIIPLSSELWLGVPMGGATNVGEPVDNYSDCKIKVDAIKWIVLNDDNTFSDCIVVGGYKYNEDGREEDYLLLVLKSKMGRILNPTSQLVAYSKFEFYWNLSGPFCIGPPGMGPYLIFNSFRNGYIVVLSNRKVVDNEIMLVSLKGIKSFAPYLGRDSKPIYFDIERDHFIPRINLQDYGYNQVMGICSEEDEEGYFVLFILLSGGKLKIYRMEDHRRIVPVFD